MIEAEARQRFVRWNAELWSELVEEGRRLLESYLRLGAEGIGFGHLFPASAGENFLTLAWRRMIPRLLPGVPRSRRAQALADCWNLGENLETSPAWLGRIFTRLAPSVSRLERLSELVSSVSEQALGEPSRRLGDTPRVDWVPLAQEDRYFLPGALHFVAPTVVCVHDRARGAEAGREAPNVGVWLSDAPLSLGTMGCREEPAASSDRLDLVERLARLDPRATDVLNASANDWRAALTLETSQFLVVLLPS
jgi:hypothetical protein